MMKKILVAVAACAAIGFGAVASAATCNSVNFVDMPWTGNLVKTETAAWILDQLGYETTVETANLGLARESVAQGDNDVSFGLWLPAARTPFSKYMIDGELNIVAMNVEGARYTLAIPEYVQEAGATHHSDLDDFRERFEGKIYGLGPGTDANETIKEMIADDAFGLGDWELIESSEAGMLAMVQRRMANEEWVVFVGWTPHPMNLNLNMAFLDGADEYWGPNGGESTVHTFVTDGFAWRCRNVGQFLKNYWFTLEEQSTMSKFVINDGMDYLEAGQRLIRETPELLERWLGHGGMLQDGPVTTADGKQNAKVVIAEALDLPN